MVKHDGVEYETYHGWLIYRRVPIAGQVAKGYMVGPDGFKAALYTREQTRPVRALALKLDDWKLEVPTPLEDDDIPEV